MPYLSNHSLYIFIRFQSFFGRTYNNIAAIAGCKHNGDCVINKKNRTACKACRLRKCLLVGMSKSGSRYGRRSNWFKIHCLLQEQQGGNGTGTAAGLGVAGGVGSGNSANLDQLARLQQASHQARQTYQDKTNPCIKSATAATSPCSLALATQTATATATAAAVAVAAASPSPGLPSFLQAAKYLNEQRQLKLDSRLSNTPSDSGASSAGDATDNGTAASVVQSSTSRGGGGYAISSEADIVERQQQRRHKELLDIFRSHSEPLYSSFTPFSLRPTGLPPLPMFKSELMFPFAAASPAEEEDEADDDDEERERERERERMAASALEAQEPIDLSLRSRTDGISPLQASSSSSPLGDALLLSRRHQLPPSGANSTSASPGAFVRKTTPLDLTLVRSQTLTGWDARCVCVQI